MFQYQLAWKKFQGWLPADMISINQGFVLSILVNLSEALAPRTLLVHRRAFNLLISELFGINFEHPHISLVASSSSSVSPAGLRGELRLWREGPPQTC